MAKMVQTKTKTRVVSENGDGRASDLAYHKLKEMITRVELAPGTTINETSLIEQIGIGRTPLREALHRLAAERMVVILPYRGILVPQLGLRDIQKIYEAREILEEQTARIAAQRFQLLPPTQRSGIEHDFNGSNSQAATSDYYSFLAADQRFHRLVAQTADNIYLFESLDRLLSLNNWLWHLFYIARGAQEQFFIDHGRIGEAILGGQSDQAGVLMRRHIAQSKEVLRTLF